MERIPLKSAPKLFDAVIQEMQVALGGGLSWLNHVFGKAEKTQREYNGQRKFYVPSVYVGGGKYEEIVPDRRDWGNYAFFYLEEPQEVSDQVRVMPYFQLYGDVCLVVWGDSRDIEAQDDRNLESIKSDILQVLGGMKPTSGRFELERIWEQDKGVFEEYSIEENMGEYMMWPYFAFRFRMRVRCDSGCIVS